MAGKAPEDRAERGKRLALTRSNARLAAVQALYQWEATGTRAESIIKEFADHRLGEVVDDVALPPADLKLFTAVVLGGTSLFGGRGLVLGSLVGALIVGVFRNGLTLMGVASVYQILITGILVILAVATDQLSRRRSA